jgi:hypothetical protein
MEMAHTLPCWSYADWLQASKVAGGFVFCRLESGNHVSENNQPKAADIRDGQQLLKARESFFSTLELLFLA